MNVCSLLNKKVKRLNDRSFHEVFMESLRQAKESTSSQPPRLIFLTGGVSRMSVIRSWCREVFPEAVVICGMEPEFSVARGLAYCARIDDELRQFKVDVDHLIASSAVETIVHDNIDTLYKSCVETMVDPILEQVPILIRFCRRKLKIICIRMTPESGWRSRRRRG